MTAVRRVHEVEFWPADMLGFSGADAMSDAINVATFGWPRFGLSHVAIVGEGPQDPVLYESTSVCDLPCRYQGACVSGVQAHGVEERVAAYKGRVWLYRMTVPLDRAERQILYRWCQEQLGKPYDFHGAIDSRDLCLGWFVQLFLPEDLKRFYCSEFVPAAMKELGLFTDNCSRWSPNRYERWGRRHGLYREPVRVVAGGGP